MSTHGAAPGERRGGRAKGVKNRTTKSVEDKLKALGCDPLEGMAEIAKQAMLEGDMSLAGQMYKELAQYIAPKRKAIEVSGVDGEAIKTDNKFIIEIVRPKNA